jgi:hypothetical protein
MTRLAHVSCWAFVICTATATAQPAGRPAKVRPPVTDPLPPPLPEPPVDLGPAPDIKAPPATLDDPFQQPLREEPKAAAADNAARASAAFAAKRYAQAAALFVEAVKAKESLTAAQRDEWAYCRLHAVGNRLNREPVDAATAAALGREVESAIRDASPRMMAFGNQLLGEIRQRSASGVITAAAAVAWEVIEGKNFRVHHQMNKEVATEVAAVAEQVRVAMYERWHGPAPAEWTPRCDIFLHPTASDYAKATGKTGPGHSTVAQSGGRATSRRIDLPADEPTLLDGPLPHEVTQVLLADLFAEQALPRWAMIGMAALAESPQEVGRYRQSIPALLKGSKLEYVGPFLDREGFGDPKEITAFYAQSVSLVAYLVELKGSKAFAAFLREAPRRGYAKVLATHYGFKDTADLQSKWLRHAVAAD